MAALVKFSLAIVLSIALTVNSALMTNNSSSVSKSLEVSPLPIDEDAVIIAAQVVKATSGGGVLHKRHTYSRGRNSVDVKKNRRKSCSRKRRPCKRLTKKFCHRRERKCRSRMSMPCRQSPGCSRRTNKRCRRKYDKCIDSYRTPVNTERPHHVNDPRHFPLIKQPILPERKKEKQPCRVTSDCQDGLCCAQYGVGRRICQSFTKKDQVCTRTFDRKRSVETYERCPCEVGLTCMSTPKLKHHYTCQGA